MAIPVWPPGLPQEPLADAYEETLVAGAIRTPMSAGPAKVRRIVSRAPTPINVSLLMTGAQVETFEDFFRETLLNGTLRFGWIYHRKASQEQIECRIIVDENRAPTISSSDGVNYRVSFLMEILP